MGKAAYPVDDQLRLLLLGKAPSMMDYDAIEDLASSFSEAIGGQLPRDVAGHLVARAPEFVEDAVDALFEISDRNAIIDTTLDRVRSETIVGYHG